MKKDYDFDEIINRKNTDAVKLEEMKKIWGRTDLIPMWVADMDFKTPDFVLQAAQRVINHQIIGYTTAPSEWFRSIIEWQRKVHDWEISKEMILYLPGVVPGLSIAVAAFTSPSDGVMIYQPVYQPFSMVIRNQNRKLVNVPLILKNERYYIDFELMREKIKDCKMFFLCHPHNPSGRVWTKQELQKIAEICEENQVLVISDEIHADLSFKKHETFAKVSEAAKINSVTFNSASKAFNMAGFNSAYAIAPNPKIRKKLKDYLQSTMLFHGHAFAYQPTISAYQNGETWLEEIKYYIQENINFTIEFFRQNLSKIKVMRPEASYLVWLDARELGWSAKELNEFFVEKAGLALNNGMSYGVEGEGFMRMNVACPRAILEKALNQLKTAYKEIF